MNAQISAWCSGAMTKMASNVATKSCVGFKIGMWDLGAYLPCFMALLSRMQVAPLGPKCRQDAMPRPWLPAP